MKQRLNVYAAGIFALASCLLTSCAVPSFAATNTPAAPEDSPSPAIEKCTAGTDDGYYTCDQYFPGGRSLTYVDYASMEERFLCADPTCTHDSDACTSYYPHDGKTQLSGVYAVGDRLLAVQIAPSGTSNAHMDLLDWDGNFQSCLAEFSAGQELSWDMSGGYYTDGESLYTTLAEVVPGTDARQEMLVRISLEDGAVSRLYEAPAPGYQLLLAGASGRELLFWEFDARTIRPDPHQNSDTLCAADTDTGETRELPYQTTDSTGIVVDGGQIFRIDWENAAFTVCTYPSESGISCDYAALRQEVLREYGTIVNEGIQPLEFTDEFCAVTFSVQDEAGDAHYIAYLYNITSGETCPFTLLQTFKEDLIQVRARTPWGLFVKKDTIPQTSAAGTGMPELYLTEWGMLPEESYLHSVPEYSKTATLALP